MTAELLAETFLTDLPLLVLRGRSRPSELASIAGVAGFFKMTGPKRNVGLLLAMVTGCILSADCCRNMLVRLRTRLNKQRQH